MHSCMETTAGDLFGNDYTTTITTTIITSTAYADGGSPAFDSVILDAHGILERWR